MLEIIAPIFNFAVVVWVLWHFGREPLRNFLASRSDKIASDIEGAKKEFGEAEHLLTEWATKWNGVEAHARVLHDEIQSRIESLREKTIKAGQGQALRIREEAKLVGQSEMTKAQLTLQRDVARQCVQIAREHIKNHVSEKDHLRLVKEYMESLPHDSTN